MPIAMLGDIGIHFELHGQRGAPLVLVHGYTGDASDWRHQVAAFAGTHRVLVMEHRGHGRSQAPTEPVAYTIERMTDDLEALIAHLGLERFHLVGHSMGGAIAQELALRSPGRLRSLTLEDTGPAFEILRNPAVARVFEAGFRLAEAQGMGALAKLTGANAPPHKTPQRIEEERERLAKMSLPAFVGAWHALSRWQGTRDRVQALSLPTLVVYGELDAGIRAGSQWLAAAIPGAVLECIPEAGHAPQDERPKLFNATLARHLRRFDSS
jgi:pimeloyl-ACP methyl ester carboxylesterase